MFPPQVVTWEDNRSRAERRAIATRPVTPEQLGLAGAQQVAHVHRTRASPGSSFVADNLRHAAALAAKLATPGDALSQALRAALPPKLRKLLAAEPTDPSDGVLAAGLVRGLNKLAKGPSLYDPVRFPERVLSPPTRAFRDEHPQPKGKALATFNRLLLCDAFPEELSAQPTTEVDWLATSRKPAQLGVEEFLRANREYWGIENGTHQRLDCSAFEDRLRVRRTNAVAILGYLHRVSISLFLAWSRTQRNPRDRTYPTWKARHDGNRWNMLHQVTRPPA